MSSQRDFSANSRLNESASCFRKPYRLVGLTLGLIGLLSVTVLYMWTVDGGRPVKMIAPPHKEKLPIKRTVPSIDIEGLVNICGHNTVNAGRPPWDKCKREFVPPNITLVSPPAGNVQVGDTIHYRIDSNLVKSSDCESGGNFWHAVLESNGKSKASCAVSIEDNCNGSYDMYALAAWPGNATFSLTLVYTADAVHHMRSVVWPAQDRVSFIGYFQHGAEQANYKKLPHSACYFRRHGNWTGLCDYPHPKAMGNTTLICDKIDGVPCNTLYIMKGHGARTEGSTKKLSENVTYLFAKPKRTTPLWIPSATLEIKGEGYDSGDLPRCRTDQPIPRFQGYWRDGVWHSLLCAIKTDWTEKTRLGECLKNKHWVLLGDSTTRQWYSLMLSLIGISVPKPPGDVYCCNMLREYKTLNATLRFQIHPHVLASFAVKIRDVMFEVDVLDGLVDPACNYVVVISPWAHFTQWTRESYVERTRLLREAVVRLRKRCPGVPVVLKGPHPRTSSAFSNNIYGSDYINKQIETINREIFKGMDVWFLPLWDINLSYPVTNNVHMPNAVVREELKMFLSFVCDP